MKVLILGSKGNLGSQLVKVFSNDNITIGWDQEDIDITNKQKLTQKVLELKPKIIINAVAYNAVDRCEEEQVQYALAKKLNAQAVADLADLAIKLKVILIHYSTDYVFKGDNKKGYSEEAQPGPINKYGKTKLMGEQEILKRRNKDLKYYLIRTSKLFGPEGKSQVAKPSFFDIMLRASQKKKDLKVVDEEMSCFTYTPDLALSTKGLIESNKKFGIYHIINASPCTWYEATKQLFKLAGIKINLKAVSGSEFFRSAKRPLYSVLLNTKLKPMRDYKKALREYLGK